MILQLTSVFEFNVLLMQLYAITVITVLAVYMKTLQLDKHKARFNFNMVII